MAYFESAEFAPCTKACPRCSRLHVPWTALWTAADLSPDAQPVSEKELRRRWKRLGKKQASLIMAC